jgi:glucosamine--fructose-6-phosphate aminotransferase (isomerizing)
MNNPVPEATRLYREAAQSAQVVRTQLAHNADAAQRLGARLREVKPRAVVTSARGSSDHAATYAKYLIETRARVITASSAPSVASVYGAQPDLRDCLYIAISQSGRSPDLLAGAQRAREAQAIVVALVNDEASPLARIADCCLPLCAGVEESVAATKSYIASLAAIAQLVAAWTEDAPLLEALDGTPAALERAWALDWGGAVERLRERSNLFVIARGVGLAVAQEAALKCKETCGLHAESFSSAEVRHGPEALLRPEFPALVFAQDDETRAGIEALARDLVERGVEVIAAGIDVPGAVALPVVRAHPAVEPLLVVQSFYKLANALAIARGLDPDRPPHLQKVTRTT